MNQVILASHGELALGALDTIRMIVGEVPNVHAVILRRDDTEPITGKVEALIDGFADEDDVFVLTDMLGSSVNNAMVELMARRPRVRVVSGMNMPLVLTLVLGDAKVTASELRSVIGEARAGIVDCANPDVSQVVTAPAPAAVSGRPSTIELARLDYRLLHGQVVFSWVGKTGVGRIIVVDDAAASDEVKKSALKLAKPANVRLNVFSVERALSKMDKLNTLGEKVMFVFGNTHELLEFCRSYPLPEVNYGATANKDGAVQFGGKDGSVFLDEAERADTQALLDLGTKIYVQQTPSYKRVDLESV